MWIKLLLISIICFTTVKQCESKFSIPQPSVDVTNGFKISITDRPGLELFVFHGKLNEDFNGHEEGEFSGEAKRTSSGVWSYENPMVELGIGDKVYYWIYVQANGLGYRLDNQVYEFDNKRKDPKPIEQPTKNKTNDVFVTPQPEVCQTTITTVKGKASCKSKLIFSEDFNTLQRSKWKEIVKIPSDKEDAEFVVYMNGIARIANGKLEIKPKLLTDLPEYSEDMFRTGNINLASQCTPDYDEQIECRRDVTNSPFQILPPIVSGRINTKNSFSFKYGKIEIRAKLPKGDWIYPELLLEPKDRYYGNGYDSGKIRIAFARGNINLVTPSTNDLSGKVLYSGAITDRFDTHRFDSASKVESQNHLGDDFHTYSLTWTNNLIIAQVDGVPYGSVFGRFKSTNKTVESAWNQGTVLAPFDQEFYITLAVGVGGLSDFPDKCESRPNLETYTKPWDNTSPKAELFFWRNKEKWLPSWNVDSKLIVDYVRVWAI